MGECGCNTPRLSYKLPAPNGGWYLVEIYSDCRYCTEAYPFIAIRIPTECEMEDLELIDELPMDLMGIGPGPECRIKCGLSRDEFVKKLTPSFVGLIADGDKLDSDGAEIHAEEFVIEEGVYCPAVVPTEDIQEGE